MSDYFLWVLVARKGYPVVCQETFESEPIRFGPFFFTGDLNRETVQQIAGDGIIDGRNIGPQNVEQIQIQTVSDFIIAVKSKTDVILINEGSYPVTPKGRRWVDSQLPVPYWEPLGDERASFRLIELVMEILTEAGADTPDPRLEIIVLPEERWDSENVELDPQATFWVHTVGLQKFEHPELELREVPALWVRSAGHELNIIAKAAMEVPIEEGDLIDGPGEVLCQMTATKSEDSFWTEQNCSCLRLTVSKVFFDLSDEESDEDTVFGAANDDKVFH